jgi:hypothetical protein
MGTKLTGQALQSGEVFRLAGIRLLPMRVEGKCVHHCRFSLAPPCVANTRIGILAFPQQNVANFSEAENCVNCQSIGHDLLGCKGIPNVTQLLYFSAWRKNKKAVPRPVTGFCLFC